MLRGATFFIASRSYVQEIGTFSFPTYCYAKRGVPLRKLHLKKLHFLEQTQAWMFIVKYNRYISAISLKFSLPTSCFNVEKIKRVRLHNHRVYPIISPTEMNGRSLR